MIPIIKIYSRLHEFFHEYLNINLPGLGFLLRKIDHDMLINFDGYKLFFNHKIADNYARLINSRFNEKETHVFIEKLISIFGGIYFIEIGANVGEFLIDLAPKFNHVSGITLFEPQTEQFKALKKTIDINKFKNIDLSNYAVSDKSGYVYFNINENNTTDSGISSIDKGVRIKSTTLNEYFDTSIFKNQVILLIDAEGAELSIFKGGLEFITKHQPIIIFEYNHVSKNFFSVEEVSLLIEKEFNIYRLRRDSYLDLDFKNTWNLVAIPNRLNSDVVDTLIKN